MRLLLPKSWIDRHAVVLALGVSVMLIVLAIVTLIVIGGLDNTPAWWGRVDTLNPVDPRVIEQAEHFENAISTQLTAVREPSEPGWAVAITEEQANAWLAARLIDTIKTHLGEDAWPDEITRVQIEIQGDTMHIGVRMAHTSGSMIVWGRIDLEVDAEGELWSELSRLHIGTTRVAAWVVSAMGSGEGITARFHIGPASIELGDGRMAQILGVRVSGGRLELAMQTIVKEN